MSEEEKARRRAERRKAKKKVSAPLDTLQEYFQRNLFSKKWELKSLVSSRITSCICFSAAGSVKNRSRLSRTRMAKG